MAGIDKTYINSYAQYREIADWCKAQGTVIDSFGNKITPYDYIPREYIWDSENETDLDMGEYTEEYINDCLSNIRKDNQKYKTEEHWKNTLEPYSDDTEYTDSISTFEKYCEHLDNSAEIPLWNTDHIFDIYLIKNCPVEFIQNRLKEQYGGGWYKEAFTKHNKSYEAIKNGVSDYDMYTRNGLKKPHFKINYVWNVPFKDDNLSWWIEVRVNNRFWNYDGVADYWYSYVECYYPKCDSWTSVCDMKYYGNMNVHRIRRLLNKWNLPEGAVVSFKGCYKRDIMKNFTVTIKK